ncbi:autophagy-related protein Atg10 [Aspergillus avenaceus]|uniref:Ubiquitin-like-conjugating enzyme ATG10 n=1 Tax=Aspergillus avenaceus TaxID=36643 RepID=A0A5N6TL09_ASPAV|nr:autophagy-related protein Atg10 [Aspergillus avenaceus]
MACSPSLSDQIPLSTFPFLTLQEFECACRAFLNRIHVLGLEGVRWSSARFAQQATGPVLKISRSICKSSIRHYNILPGSVATAEPQVEICEDDPEALIRTPDPSVCLQIDYDIIWSPTYQTPVLYFLLRHSNHPGPLGIDEVYQYLVPDQYKRELQNVGVMGGISFGYHPQSGIPAFFVHPCNTADAMKQIANPQHITPELYLIMWIGIVGSRLSLHLPREIFEMDGLQKLEG